MSQSLVSCSNSCHESSVLTENSRSSPKCGSLRFVPLFTTEVFKGHVEIQVELSS
jgi:hypothetical protein